MDPSSTSLLRSKLGKLSVAQSKKSEISFDICDIDDIGPGAGVKSRKRDKFFSLLKHNDTPWPTVGAVSFSPKLFTSYQYPQIGENAIRILDILPASGGYHDAAVHCKLREFRLDLWPESQPADYCALSYAWGPTSGDGSHLTQKIICDGHSLPVTANLHAALKRIRQKTAEEQLPRTSLWVDALCINQRDADERNRQVAMMFRIYRNASSLYIWLGDADTTLAANIRSICSLGSGWKFAMDPRSNGIKQREALLYWRDKASALETEALQQLVQRSWFKRRWILQEVASSEMTSTRVLLGDVQIPGEDFVATLELTDLLKSVRAFRFTSTASRKGNILYNLQVFDEAQCSNPRDRIYALLNIAWSSPWMPGETQQKVIVNYAQTVEECYYEFAKIKAQRAQELVGIMACATSRPSPSSTKPGLPSWCPDWRVQVDYRSMRHQTACWRALDAVCHAADSQIVGSTLIVKGRVLKPCPRVTKAQDFICRDCSTCIFARAAMRTKEGLKLVAILAKDEAEDDDTSLLLLDDCSIAFWVRPQVFSLAPEDREELAVGLHETLYELHSCVEVPEYARNCHYITRRGDIMPLVEVAIS